MEYSREQEAFTEVIQIWHVVRTSSCREEGGMMFSHEIVPRELFVVASHAEKPLSKNQFPNL